MCWEPTLPGLLGPILLGPHSSLGWGHTRLTKGSEARGWWASTPRSAGPAPPGVGGVVPSCPSCWKPFTPWGQQSFPPPPLAATTLSHPQTLAHRGPHHSLRQAATSPSPALQGKQSFGRWGLEVGVPGSSWGLLAPCCKVLVPGGSPGRGRAAGLGADAWAPTQSCSCRALLHPFVPLPAPPFWFLGGPPWPSWDPLAHPSPLGSSPCSSGRNTRPSPRGFLLGG